MVGKQCMQMLCLSSDSTLANRCIHTSTVHEMRMERRINTTCTVCIARPPQPRGGNPIRPWHNTGRRVRSTPPSLESGCVCRPLFLTPSLCRRPPAPRKQVLGRQSRRTRTPFMLTLNQTRALHQILHFCIVIDSIRATSLRPSSTTVLSVLLPRRS